MPFNFKIITPERELFSDVVNEVLIPTKQGQIGVLTHHIPLVSVLVPGEMIIKKESEEIPLVVSGGFVQIDEKSVTILADTAERIEEIDEKRAEEARRRAEEQLKEETLSVEQYAMLTAKMEKELARLRVRRKYKDVGRQR